METESREKERTDASQWRHIGADTAYRSSDAGITESLQRQLQAMHSTFLTASDSILAQISETGEQLEQLEKRIDEMVKEATGGLRVNPYSAPKRSPRQ